MVKSYLRYENLSQFGIVASGNCNVVWLPGSSSGRALVGGLEDALVWDLKTGSLEGRLHDSSCTNCEVTRVAVDSSMSEMIATGHSDGSVRVWDIHSFSLLFTFNGHKSSITALKFDRSGTKLYSASRDCNVVAWDLVSEVGLFRLKGHTGEITGIGLISESKVPTDEKNIMRDDIIEDDKYLLSCSKDGLIKLWDLESQHCVETHVANKSECWALDFKQDSMMAITTGSGKDVKVWKISLRAEDGEKIHEEGTLIKQSSDRGIHVQFHPTQNYFAVANSDKTVEVWKQRTAEEIKKKLARKSKKEKSKKGGSTTDVSEESGPKENDIDVIYNSVTVFRCSARIKSFDWMTTKKVALVANLANNSIESYSISSAAVASRKYLVDLQGHRNDIRALAISSDNQMVATASNGLLKLWNIQTHKCIRTFECGYVLCLKFLPGDSIIVAGTRNGTIDLYDVQSSSLLESIEDAHKGGAVWCMDISHDGKFIVTGGADKVVKFWDFRVITSETGVSSLRLKHTRSLELDDEVLSVKLSTPVQPRPFSNDEGSKATQPLIACSLLDNTVKVFFADTLKFFLSLYGHKLPVLSLDISDDSKILVSCSADKNVKIWGLDFGDCHKSIFAHQDAIMQVKFEPGSHNFFTSSKDRLLKYWDGDKFENIQRLSGHHGEIWAMDIASDGTFVVSGSHDKSIRVWQQTEDQVFIEEEREKELEELYESNMVEDNTLEVSRPDDDGEDVEMATKATVETLKAGEKIMEAIDIAIAELDRNAKLAADPSAEVPAANIVLQTLNVSPEKHVLNIVEKVKPSQLYDALLVFSFTKILQLLQLVEIWAEKAWNCRLITRILTFIVQVHHKQLISVQSKSADTLIKIKASLQANLDRERSQIGYNVAGLSYVLQNWRLNHNKEFFDEAESAKDKERLMKKRVFGSTR